MIVSYIIGFIFGIGLLLGGVTEPENILSFLDVKSDTWNSAIAVVLATAVIVYGIGSRYIMRRRRPMIDATFHLPSNTRIDFGLIFGAALFGIGWGLTGFCPGPAVVSAAMLRPKGLLFLAFMILGMLIYGTLYQRKRPAYRSH